jgi:hypothetical protein
MPMIVIGNGGTHFTAGKKGRIPLDASLPWCRRHT